MTPNSLGSFALDTVRAAMLVMRWSLGMMLLGALASMLTAVILLDEAVLWVRSGWLGKLATLALMLALLILPWVWSGLGRALGIRKAASVLLAGRSEAAIGYLLRAVSRTTDPSAASAGASSTVRVSPAALLRALRKPSTLSGPARWLAWLIRWQLDLQRTETHLEQAQTRADATGGAADTALAQALAADLGERWLEPDASLLWALGLSQLLLVSALAWLW
jgi:hypothetical protein